MAIPDYCDPRAEKNFTRGLVGISHGDNGSAYRYSWDSQCGQKKTTMVDGYCAYCGNRGLPLQPLIDIYRDFTVLGHTCICKDAMDELELKDAVNQVRIKAEKEIQALEDKMPKINPKVIKTLAEDKLKSSLKHIERGFCSESILNDLNITLER